MLMAFSSKFVAAHYSYTTVTVAIAVEVASFTSNTMIRKQNSSTSLSTSVKWKEKPWT